MRRRAVRLDRDPRDIIPPREPQPASGEAGLVEQADQSCARVVDVQQAVAVSREHEDDVARQDGIADVQQRRLTVADHLEEAMNAHAGAGPRARATPRPRSRGGAPSGAELQLLLGAPGRGSEPTGPRQVSAGVPPRTARSCAS